MKSLRLLLAGLALLCAATGSRAESHRVDDSSSQVLGSTLKLRPVARLAHGNRMNVVSGDINVAVRLDVSAWKGRQGRIYMMLPRQSDGSLAATWTSRGQLMPGVVRTGGRTLVYAGLIREGMLEDTLRLNVRGDERRLPRDAQLAFAFEIDLDTP